MLPPSVPIDPPSPPAFFLSSLATLFLSSIHGDPPAACAEGRRQKRTLALATDQFGAPFLLIGTEASQQRVPTMLHSPSSLTACGRRTARVGWVAGGRGRQMARPG